MQSVDYEYKMFTRYWNLTENGLEVDRALEKVSQEWGLSLEQVKYDINEVYEEYVMSDWLDVDGDPLGFEL